MVTLKYTCVLDDLVLPSPELIYEYMETQPPVYLFRDPIEAMQYSFDGASSSCPWISELVLKTPGLVDFSFSPLDQVVSINDNSHTAAIDLVFTYMIIDGTPETVDPDTGLSTVAKS